MTIASVEHEPNKYLSTRLSWLPMHQHLGYLADDDLDLLLTKASLNRNYVVGTAMMSVQVDARARPCHSTLTFQRTSVECSGEVFGKRVSKLQLGDIARPTVGSEGLSHRLRAIGKKPVDKSANHSLCYPDTRTAARESKGASRSRPRDAVQTPLARPPNGMDVRLRCRLSMPRLGKAGAGPSVCNGLLDSVPPAPVSPSHRVPSLRRPTGTLPPLRVGTRTCTNGPKLGERCAIAHRAGERYIVSGFKAASLHNPVTAPILSKYYRFQRALQVTRRYFQPTMRREPVDERLQLIDRARERTGLERGIRAFELRWDRDSALVLGHAYYNPLG